MEKTQTTEHNVFCITFTSFIENWTEPDYHIRSTEAGCGSEIWFMHRPTEALEEENIFTDQDSLIKIFLSDVFYDLSECGGIVYCNDPYITDSIMSELQEKEYEWIQDNPEYLEDDPDRLYDEMKQNL